MAYQEEASKAFTMIDRPTYPRDSDIRSPAVGELHKDRPCSWTERTDGPARCFAQTVCAPVRRRCQCRGVPRRCNSSDRCWDRWTTPAVHRLAPEGVSRIAARRHCQHSPWGYRCCQTSSAMGSAADSWSGHGLLFFRSVTAQSIGGYLELLGPVTEAEEAQDPQEDPDRFGTDHLDRTHVDSLRIVAEPASISP